MIHENIEFHNVVMEPSPTGGMMLPRYPSAVRNAFSERGRFVAMESTGGEMRFVTDAKNVRVYLSSVDNDADVHVYRGDFFLATHTLSKGQVSVIHLEPPARFNEVADAMVSRGGFSPSVWRIRFNRACTVFHGLDAFGHDVRPPKKDEKPAKTLLCYGSSITHSNANGYPAHAARILGMDVYNKGLSGACQCEKEAADYIASLPFDAATLELGVNMRGGYTTEEFKRRAEYVVEKVMAAGKPVFLITIFPNFSDFARESNIETVRDREYCDVLRDLTASKRSDRLFLIEGSDVLSDITGLTCDLIHPSDYGHAHMGANLARLMREKIA
ncbi:MAG: GDSL-type esterase/lipase family protein [Spirochaetota bacterium]